MASEQSGTDRVLSRREFVTRLSAAAGAPGLAMVGLGALTSTQKAEAADMLVDRVGKLPVRNFGTRMKAIHGGPMKVTPMAICRDWSPELYGPGLDLGINFIHKAGYWNRIPDELARRPRESYYTDATVDSTPNNPDDEDGAYNQVVHSLEKNGLKYYDIFRAHYGWHSVAAFKNQTGTYRAFKRLKAKGLVRYFGVSQHSTPENFPAYPEIIQAEIDSGIIDSMQVWFSASSSPEIMEAFAKAHQAGIAMTAMKTFAHGHNVVRSDPGLQKKLGAEGMVGRTCVRFALNARSHITRNKPIFHCVVSAIHDFGTFEENVGAVGGKIARAEGFTLEA